MDAEVFKVEVGKLLKLQGFKKSNATWRKDFGESIAVLNVQKSQWNDGVYYINVGIYLKTLGKEVAPTQNRCHIGQRLQVEEPESVVSAALGWFSSRSTLDAVRLRHKEGTLMGNGIVMKVVIEAITT